MITGALRSKIDRLWLEFHSGGITNPLTVIEQITYLMFLRLLDISEMRNEKKAARSKNPIKRVFATGEPTALAAGSPDTRRPAASLDIACVYGLEAIARKP